MKNKGFTLVELLAVIAVLAVLAVLSVPNILKLYNEAKKKTFLNDVKTIYKEVSKKYLIDGIKNNNIERINSNGDNKLNLESNNLTYDIKIDRKGTIEYIMVSNDNYCIEGKYKSINDLTIDIIKDEKCEINKEEEPVEPVEPDEPEIVVPVINCTYNGTLRRGAEFKSGDYTYRYMQQGSSGSTRLTWENINIDGWGVQLTDKTSKNPIKSEVCTNISGKPVVSMKYAFYASESTSIDLSSFNTDNVKDMGAMFSYTNFANIDLSTFNTKNAESMYGMFHGAVAKKIDVSGFDTSKVTDMSWMFSSTSIDNLDLSKFNTSKVTNMYGMFSSTKVKELDLTSFDTSRVSNMQEMFSSTNTSTIDLSSFNISGVKNSQNMFNNCSATTIYAKNNNDINWFKRTGRIPWNLKFVVKDN